MEEWGRNEIAPAPLDEAPGIGRRKKQWSMVAAVAPVSIAGVWAMATGSALLIWSVTGWREPLDWCRSAAALEAMGALLVVSTAVASLRDLLASCRALAARLAHVRRPVRDWSVTGEWRLDEGGFVS